MNNFNLFAVVHIEVIVTKIIPMNSIIAPVVISVNTSGGVGSGGGVGRVGICTNPMNMVIKPTIPNAPPTVKVFSIIPICSLLCFISVPDILPSTLTAPLLLAVSILISIHSFLLISSGSTVTFSWSILSIGVRSLGCVFIMSASRIFLISVNFISSGVLKSSGLIGVFPEFCMFMIVRFRFFTCFPFI